MRLIAIQGLGALSCRQGATDSSLRGSFLRRLETLRVQDVRRGPAMQSFAASRNKDSIRSGFAGASATLLRSLAGLITMAAGARSHSPRHWLRSQMARPPEHGEPAATSRISSSSQSCSEPCVSRQCHHRRALRRRPGLERKHSVERRHAMNFGRGNVQPQRRHS